MFLVENGEKLLSRVIRSMLRASETANSKNWFVRRPSTTENTVTPEAWYSFSRTNHRNGFQELIFRWFHQHQDGEVVL